MKNSMQKMVQQALCTVLFLGACMQVMAGSWSTEYFLEGMDSVHIYKPSTTPAVNGKRALMLNLHGCGMSNTDMKNNAGWESVADDKGMVVAIPDVPGSGVNGECWDYYGENHTRYNNYNNEIINLAKELMSRASLNIDSNQVYITGFSSGAAQSIVVGCLAPDIFAGVGAHSAPGLGTSAFQFGSAPWGYDEQDQADLCEDLAGNHSDDFDTQIYSTIHGQSDYTVAFDYNATGADIMSRVYDAKTQGFSQTIATGGTKVIFYDATGPRVSKISVSGLGHAWSNSDGNSGYFSNRKVDYPEYVTAWFFEHNRRVSIDGGTGGDPVDADGDGVAFAQDCDDADSSIFPGATEVCGDGVDQDCDGVDEVCSGGWTCVEHYARNTDHYNANPSRVTYRWLGGYIYYYAIGSGQKLPSAGSYSYATLAETSEGYYVVGSCP